MKKFLVCLLAICLGMSFTASAQTAYSKQKAKQAKKEYKQKVKKYKKEGWEIFGSSNTLEMALLNHYEALEKDGVTELIGHATSASKNIGKDKLMMAACSIYAHMIGGSIKGRIIEEMGSMLSTEELSDFDNFYAAYENKVKTEVRGELRPSFSIYRPVKIQGRDAFEFEAYYIIDEEAASRARIRAFQKTAKVSDVAQKYADKVSKFIEESEFIQE